MSVRAGRSPDGTVRHSPAGRWLGAAAGASLVAAGLLLWWRHGDAVFTDIVLAALAWCF